MLSRYKHFMKSGYVINNFFLTGSFHNIYVKVFCLDKEATLFVDDVLCSYD